jgi:hypothetical protein
MDADGQHALADIPSLIGEIKKVPLAGIIIGKRAMKPGVMPPARILSNKITSFILTRYAHQPILDSQCGYRLYNSSFLQAITIEYNRFEMESEVILKAAHLKYPIRFVEVQTLYLDQTSHISHILDTFRWVRAVLKVHRTVSLR